MYTVKPLGINIKDDDWSAKDGLLQESINIQWRDNALRPLPNRIFSDIDSSGYTNVIFHKVSDENKINVLGFVSDVSPVFLAFDLAGGLTGTQGENNNVLTWFGTIEDGVFSTVPLRYFSIRKTEGLSFTVLNGLLYFMGNGTIEEERYFKRLQYNETDNEYEEKDMYAWKSLIPFFPEQNTVELTGPGLAYNNYSRCGLILVRFALVLNSGEIVLPTPIYGYTVNGITRGETAAKKGDVVENIHSIINMDLSFLDDALLAEEISAINVYACVPFYLNEFTVDQPDVNYWGSVLVDSSTVKSEFARMAETNFFLVKTIEKPSDEKLLLSVGSLDSDIDVSDTYSSVDISTIAAGEILPVDNFTYHKLYGQITSFNGRLIVDNPTTVLTGGHLRALALLDQESDISYEISTEDGKLKGTPIRIDKAVETVDGNKIKSRGLLSYPDVRASYVGGNEDIDVDMSMYKCRANTLHNMSCVFNMATLSIPGVFMSQDGSNFKAECEYSTTPRYFTNDKTEPVTNVGKNDNYKSENRFQFSQAGEFSVWPAINSYRVGNGKIMRIGNNSVDPSNADVVAPLIIGTSDGIYTVNLDPTGENLITSITKTANIPYISSEVLQIDGAIVFVSDKGLMAINNGEVINLTKDFFPVQGNGSFPVNETVLPGYNTLTNKFFGGDNPYILDDIVTYMRGALFAFDGRRDTIWCSNPNYNFSLTYDTKSQTWSMSTLVFNHVAEYYALKNTAIGDIYTRFMVKSDTSDNMIVLSGEDLSTEVDFHILSRTIKFTPLNNPSKDADIYKQLERMYARCVLLRNTVTGYFSLGLWGKQDINKQKKAIPLALKSDDRAATFPNDVRQDIPVNNRKGKYKTVTVLLSGKALPNSSINELEFVVGYTDNQRRR